MYGKKAFNVLKGTARDMVRNCNKCFEKKVLERERNKTKK